MSDEYFDIVGFRKTRSGKPYAVKLGSAKRRDDNGFYLNFDALPYGEMDVVVAPQRERTRSKPQSGDGDDSETPF